MSQTEKTRDPEAIRQDIEETQADLAEAVEHVAYHKTHLKEEVTEAAKAQVIEAKDQLIDNVTGRTGHLKETVTEKAHDLKDTFTEKKDDLQQSANAESGEGSGVLGDAKDKAVEIFDTVKTKVTEAVHGHPGADS